MTNHEWFTGFPFEQIFDNPMLLNIFEFFEIENFLIGVTLYFLCISDYIIFNKVPEVRWNIDGLSGAEKSPRPAN